MGPLTGIRIVEFDGLGPVPLCAMVLADLGADIVRVTRKIGDAGAHFDDVGGAILHRSRRHIPLDLKSESDREALFAVIDRADAVIEGFRPGVIERLGFAPEVCLARNPRLVFGRMTGWGQTGPLAPRAGHDINYIALTGALHAIGAGDSPPPPPLNLIGDNGGGAMLLAVGVLAALLEAERHGRGQIVDAAMTDGSALLMSLFYALHHGERWSDNREANLLDGGRPFYRCYRCSDGKFVAVGALEPPFFAALLKGLGLAADAFDQTNEAGWPEMQRCFRDIFNTKPRDVWAELFAEVDACVSPVLSLEEAPRNAHNKARGTFTDRNGVVQPAPAPRFSVTPLTNPVACAEPLSVATLLERWQLKHA